MLRAISLFLFCWGCTYLTAQTLYQAGLTRELNSGKKPVPNVFIKFEDAVNTTSDDGGQFRLAFQGKQAGDAIFLEKITKAGYEIVNQQELEITQATRSGKLSADIILARVGQVDAMRAQYFQVSLQALEAGYRREKEALKTQLKQSAIQQEAFFTQINQLKQQVEHQQQHIKTLADQFARTNFDDVSVLYKEALTLFQQGKIDSCKLLLINANLLSRTKGRLQERERIRQVRTRADEDEAANEAGIKEDMQALLLQAQTHLLDFEFSSATAIYDQLLLLDSTDLEILGTAASFFLTQHRYQKAQDIYRKMLDHPAAGLRQKADIWIKLGKIARQTQRLSIALESFSKARQLYGRLLDEQSTQGAYERGLANTYVQLGLTHMALNQLEQAEINFSLYYTLSLQQIQADPENPERKNTLALAYQYLAEVYRPSQPLDSIFPYLRENNLLLQELRLSFPLHPPYSLNLAISYARLAEAFSSLGQLDSAFIFQQKSHRMFLGLHRAYPFQIEYKRNLVISDQSLAHTFSQMANLDSAFHYLNRSMEGARQLVEDFPTNLTFQHHLALGHRKQGDYRLAKGDTQAAHTAYQQHARLMEELYQKDPENMASKNELAIAYTNLGRVYQALGQADSALHFHQKRILLSHSLYQATPQNQDLKNGLMVAYQNLGFAYQRMGNPDSALAYFQRRYQFAKALSEANPLKPDAKNSLAISHQFLAWIYEQRKAFPQAKTHLEQFHQVSQEVSQALPAHTKYKNDLALSHQQLALFHARYLGDLTTAKTHLKQAQTLWSELLIAAPNVQAYRTSSRIVSVNLWEVAVAHIKGELELTTDTLQRYQLLDTLSDKIAERLAEGPSFRQEFVTVQLEKAWFGFFISKFAENEEDLRAGLKLFPDHKYLISNLAPSLLFQGKFAEARALYEQYQAQAFGEPGYETYRDAFLEDLEVFEKAGVIPASLRKDVRKIRRLLRP